MQKILAGALLVACVAPRPARGQSLVEIRGSSTEYRFVDFTHTFRNRLVSDVLYLGAPGSNELYFGGGYQWKPAGGLTVTPLLYGIVAKENRERGLAVCANVLLESGKLRVLGFVGHFFRLSGGVDDYDFLDSLDLTRVVGGRWEVGVSGGFLHAGDDWNPLLGPTLKLNDAKGTTALALRGGYRTEVRLIRTLTF